MSGFIYLLMLMPSFMASSVSCERRGRKLLVTDILQPDTTNSFNQTIDNLDSEMLNALDGAGNINGTALSPAAADGFNVVDGFDFNNRIKSNKLDNTYDTNSPQRQNAADISVNGSVKGDPVLTAFDGQRFEFHGEGDHYYNLASETGQFQVLYKPRYHSRTCFPDRD
jgi:hypothetical protein